MTNTLWKLTNFHHCMSAWIGRERPTPEYVGAVGGWVESLVTDPRRSARRQTDLGPNFWFARVPGASDGKLTVVALYEIDEFKNIVRCHTIATLREPII